MDGTGLRTYSTKRESDWRIPEVTTFRARIKADRERIIRAVGGRLDTHSMPGIETSRAQSLSLVAIPIVDVL